eukprot:jgi/Psemu1/64046/estExt_Genemark1.C_480062
MASSPHLGSAKFQKTIKEVMGEDDNTMKWHLVPSKQTHGGYPGKKPLLPLAETPIDTRAASLFQPITINGETNNSNQQPRTLMGSPSVTSVKEIKHTPQFVGDVKTKTFDRSCNENKTPGTCDVLDLMAENLTNPEDSKYRFFKLFKPKLIANRLHQPILQVQQVQVNKKMIGGINSFLSMESTTTAFLTGLFRHFQNCTIYHILRKKPILRRNKIIKMQFSDIEMIFVAKMKMQFLFRSKFCSMTHFFDGNSNSNSNRIRIQRLIQTIQSGIIFLLPMGLAQNPSTSISQLSCTRRSKMSPTRRIKTPPSLYPQWANIALKGQIAAANQADSSHYSLIDHGTVLRAQIVPQEDSPIIYAVQMKPMKEAKLSPVVPVTLLASAHCRGQAMLLVTSAGSSAGSPGSTASITFGLACLKQIGQEFLKDQFGSGVQALRTSTTTTTARTAISPLAAKKNYNDTKPEARDNLHVESQQAQVKGRSDASHWTNAGYISSFETSLDLVLRLERDSQTTNADSHHRSMETCVRDFFRT